VLWSEATQDSKGHAVNAGDIRWDGKNVINTTNGEIVHSQFPGTFINDLHVIHNAITGKDEPNFVIDAPKSYDEMVAQLEAMRERGDFHAVVKVHMNTDLLNRTMVDNQALVKLYKDAGEKMPGSDHWGDDDWHVFSVIDMTYVRTANGKFEPYVSIDDQHGKGSDRILNRVPLSDLFLATKAPTDHDHLNDIKNALAESPNDLVKQMELARCSYKLTQSIETKLKNESNEQVRADMISANKPYMIDADTFKSQLKTIIADAKAQSKEGRHRNDMEYLIKRCEQLLKST
jgi:hypothetical protein